MGLRQRVRFRALGHPKRRRANLRAENQVAGGAQSEDHVMLGPGLAHTIITEYWTGSLSQQSLRTGCAPLRSAPQSAEIERKHRARQSGRFVKLLNPPLEIGDFRNALLHVAVFCSAGEFLRLCVSIAS